MSIQGTFRLSGLLPVRESAPCFATPLFVLEGSNREFIQEVDRELRLLGLLEPSLPAVPRPIRDLPARKLRFVEDPYLAFLPLGPDIIFGTVADISGRLREEGRRLTRFPFVQRSVARFLGDAELQTEAEANIRHRQGREAGLGPDLAAIPTVSVSMTVVRLTAASMLPARLFETEVENKAFTELASNAPDVEVDELNFESAPEEQAMLRRLLNASLRYSSPMGSQFAPPGRGAFYAAATLEGAASEIGWFQAQQVISLGVREATSREFLISEWDVVGELADLRHLVLERDNYSRSQWLGEKLRSAGRHGVLFASQFGDSAPSLCLFDAKLVRAGRLRGSLVVRVDEGGQVSYSAAAEH